VEKLNTTKAILTTYLRRLTNLSGNNRSLFLPRLGSEQFIDLHELSQLQKEKSFTIIEALIADKKKTICALADSRMAAVNEASKKLKKLNRLDQFLFEERGSRDLHVGWPFVRGKFSDGTLVRCPLIFFPVSLELENNHWILKPREDADITFNKSFLLAHSFYHQLKTDESLLEENFEEADHDSTVFRTFVYQILQKSNLEINFNQDNYQNELITFESFKKEEFEEAHFNGQLKLFPEAVLGIFPQSGSYLIPDYTDLIENNKISDLEDFFSKRSVDQTGNQNFLQQVKEDKVFPAFSMDAWQENALKAVKLGHSIVVQGPPGTGKSQLICNLIADGLATGKKILVVCQKRAALDVVYNRLAENNISDFLALVHDFKNDRKNIFKKAAHQIEHIDEYRGKNNSIDSIQLERKFLHVSRGIDQITEELEEYKKTFFDESDSGYSAKELYLRCSIKQPSAGFKQEYNIFTKSYVEEFLPKLKRYAGYAQQFSVPEHPWAERKPFTSRSIADLKTMKQLPAEAKTYFINLQNELHQSLGTKPDWHHCEEFWKNKSRAYEMIQNLNEESHYHFFLRALPFPDDETSTLWLANQARIVDECFKGAGVEISIKTENLGEFQAALLRSMRTRRGLLGKMRWEMFSKDKNLIKRTLVANELKANKDGFEILESKLDNRLNLEHNLSKLRSKAWLNETPKEYTAEKFREWFESAQKGVRAKMIFLYIRGLRNFIDPHFLDMRGFTSKMERLYQPLYQLQQKKNEWSQYLTYNQISRIINERQYVNQLEESIQKDFDAICEYDKLHEHFSETERVVIDRIRELTLNWDPQEICSVFLNSVYLSWLEHLETKYPILRIPSSGRLANLERELKELIHEKEKISNEILLLRAREQVIDNLEFNRLNNRVTYRDLHHQLTKKKKIWPVRKVVNEFDEEIFRLLPCWLTSPESASAIFPMREMFDLVIFDEASQCFAEQGIPALYRARQAVIAGDSQQLRPSDLYMTRWIEEDTDQPDLEIDSLLNLGSRYLMSMTLQGHYRSQSLELIEFSNHHFYKGKLNLLPDRHAFNKKEPVIQYIQVDGIWDNQTNLKEAEQIAELVFEYHQHYSGKQIGVVTFNAPQQALVLDLLEEKFKSNNIILPSSLFVKNIENVQGDERDVIIFSIGYARDKKKKLAAQFGSLNLAGGENRLNVAITRAREKIIVVASILADELKVEDAKNAGPRLLKEYLHFAWQVSNGLKAHLVSASSKINSSSSLQLKNIMKEQLPQRIEASIEDEIVPFADLVVRKQDTYTGLILTDDTHYFQSMSAKAWHAQTPHLFEIKNWKYTLAHSRQCWIDPDRFFNEVGKFVL
jgi:superfamily I DNA and/or RNA helicase